MTRVAALATLFVALGGLGRSLHPRRGAILSE
jgi:hypothetical protein